MNGAIVSICRTGEYGLLTTDHAASSYGLHVFIPLDGEYRQTGEPARGAGEVEPLISCGYVGDLPIQGGRNQGWTEELRVAVLVAGFRFAKA